ncbi:helix-turn-helix domain-containing protein [Salinactinospora qingdaonensis]|uniref:Helix-turn-helix transcriptional regulator n=1 Tax=Salinactinospora qingdaonensis TaxID=702744 RepID=A0ABP7F2P7_9ACTN
MAASPTLRRRRLARELLRMREEAGLTAKQAATRAKDLSPDRPWFEAKITRIENRKILRIRDVDIQTLLDVYGVEDRLQREGYRKLAREASQSGWWVGYKDVVGAGTYVDLETEVTRIRTYEVLHLPGLLQTEDYARAVIRAGGVTSEEEVDRRVEVRMMRQHILHRADAPRLWAVIDESAFRKIPADVATGQLRHLIDVQRQSLRIQVLPDSVGPHMAMDGSFVILDFPADPSIVYLDQSGSSLFYEEGRDLEHYETVYDHVHASALSVEESQAWMRRRLETLE